jgi:hypothetical protein
MERWCSLVRRPRKANPEEEKKNLFSLADNILGYLCRWLSLEDFCRLDTSICHSVNRPRFLGALEAGWFIRDDLLILYVGDNCLEQEWRLQWKLQKRLKFINVALEEYRHIGRVDENAARKGYDICVSQGGWLAHLELLELKKFRNGGRYDEAAGRNDDYCTCWSSHNLGVGAITDDMVDNITKSCLNITSLDIQVVPNTRLTYRSFNSLLESYNTSLTSLSFGHSTSLTISLHKALYTIRKQCHRTLRSLEISFHWKVSQIAEQQEEEEEEEDGHNDFATLPAMHALQSLTVSRLRCGGGGLLDILTILRKCSCTNLTHISLFRCNFNLAGDDVFEEISQTSIALRSVKFEECDFWANSNILRIFLHNRPLLQQISILDIKSSVPILDICTPMVIHSNLVSLHIRHSFALPLPEVFFHYLAMGCPLLTSVIFSSLTDFKRSCILPILMNCKILKKLWIDDCCSLQFHEYIDDVITYCDALEELLLPNHKNMYLGHQIMLQLRRYISLPLFEKSFNYAQVLRLSEHELGFVVVL